MSGMTFHPDWEMPSPMQNASAEKGAGTSDGRELLPRPQVRPSFLFPQMVLGAGGWWMVGFIHGHMRKVDEVCVAPK